MKEQKTYVLVLSFIGAIVGVLGIAFVLFWFDPFKINGTDFGNEVISERETETETETTTETETYDIEIDPNEGLW